MKIINSNTPFLYNTRIYIYKLIYVLTLALIVSCNSIQTSNNQTKNLSTETQLPSELERSNQGATLQNHDVRALSKKTLDQVNELLQSIYPQYEPGAAVMIHSGSRTLFKKAYGMANLEHGITMHPDMVFRIASLTKQFTATAILILEQQGKLSTEDTLDSFLKDYPSGSKISVENLLNHTSGIRSYTEIPGWWEDKIIQEYSPEELINEFKNEPMDFEPGTQFKYNNSAYAILGLVIEKASGQTYQEFIEEAIINPLGMKHTLYDHHDEIIFNRVNGYSKAKKGFHNAPYLSMTQPYAAGGLVSTVGDLAKWNNGLFSLRLLTEASLRKMVTPTKLENGRIVPYGYGLGLNKLKKHPMIAHSGSIHGFRSFALWLPEQSIYIAILTNSDSGLKPPGEVAHKIVKILLKSENYD